MEPHEYTTILDSRAQFLAARGKNYTSQFGEDGLIAACLERFGVQHHWCFEVGAADGLFFSNTLSLREAGWSALLIEGELSKYTELLAYRSDRVSVVQEFIGWRSLDKLLALVNAPFDLDVGVIDIDGQDYWAWAGMKQYRPRLMLVEFNRAYDATIPPLGTVEPGAQAGLTDILNLGVQKGYTALAHTHVNLLFARNDLL